MPNTRKSKKKLKEDMLEAMRKSLGNITKSCEKIGIDRKTHYNWLNDDPNYKEKIENVMEREKDFAENQLRELMEDKNPTAIIFFLKTKGKDRGYVEQQDLNISNRPAYEKLAETFEEIEQSSKKSNKE